MEIELNNRWMSSILLYEAAFLAKDLEDEPWYNSVVTDADVIFRFENGETSTCTVNYSVLFNLAKHTQHLSLIHI